MGNRIVNGIGFPSRVHSRVKNGATWSKATKKFYSTSRSIQISFHLQPVMVRAVRFRALHPSLVQ
jgi:hypothetical protein